MISLSVGEWTKDKKNRRTEEKGKRGLKSNRKRQRKAKKKNEITKKKTLSSLNGGDHAYVRQTIKTGSYFNNIYPKGKQKINVAVNHCSWNISTLTKQIKLKHQNIRSRWRCQSYNVYLISSHTHIAREQYAPASHSTCLQINDLSEVAYTRVHARSLRSHGKEY